MLNIIIYVLDISQLRYHEQEILQGKKNVLNSNCKHINSSNFIFMSIILGKVHKKVLDR